MSKHISDEKKAEIRAEIDKLQELKSKNPTASYTKEQIEADIKKLEKRLTNG